MTLGKKKPRLKYHRAGEGFECLNCPIGEREHLHTADEASEHHKAKHGGREA